MTTATTTKLGALRANLGKRSYFSTVMSLSEAVERLTVVENTELPIEARVQRRLNRARLPGIASYILKNEETYLFASLVVSVKKMTFKPASGADHFGTLSADFSGALINDGQHRLAGIGRALQEKPSLGSHEISVLVFNYQSVDQAQQMFSDLNRYTKPTPAGLNIAFSHDNQAEITRRVINSVSMFGAGFVEQERGGSLPLKSAKMFSNVAIDDGTAGMLAPMLTAKPPIDASVENQSRVASETWEYVFGLIPAVLQCRDGLLQAPDLRESLICTHSPAVRALGRVAGKIRMLCGENKTCWKKRLAPIADIDWRRTNPEFIKRNIVLERDGKTTVASNRQAREEMEKYLAETLHIMDIAPERGTDQKVTVVSNGQPATKRKRGIAASRARHAVQTAKAPAVAAA